MRGSGGTVDAMAERRVSFSVAGLLLELVQAAADRAGRPPSVLRVALSL